MIERYPDGWTGGPMNDQEKAYARRYSEYLRGQRKTEPRHTGLSATNARMIRSEIERHARKG